MKNKALLGKAEEEYSNDGKGFAEYRPAQQQRRKDQRCDGIG